MKPSSPRSSGLSLLLGFALCGALLSAAPVRAQDEAADPFAIAREAYEAAASPAAKLAIVERFLTDHPAHARFAAAVRAGKNVLLDELDDRQAAVDFVQRYLPLAPDDAARDDLQDLLLDLYSHPDYAAALTELVGRRYDLAAMTYVEHVRVLDAAAKAEAWGLLAKHAAAAESQANADAFRAAYPDRDFSEDYIADAGRNRQGLLRTYTGWAAANQGDLARAEKDFEAAKTLVRKTFFGLPDNELYRFWGLTLLKQGRRDQGLEMLALAGLYGNDEAALAAAREAFTDQGRRQTSFDDYLWDLRRDRATKMADFTAVDYEDVQHAYTSLRGEKATLLAFWFPT